MDWKTAYLLIMWLTLAWCFVPRFGYSRLDLREYLFFGLGGSILWPIFWFVLVALHCNRWANGVYTTR